MIYAREDVIPIPHIYHISGIFPVNVNVNVTTVEKKILWGENTDQINSCYKSIPFHFDLRKAGQFLAVEHMTHPLSFKYPVVGSSVWYLLGK